MRFDVRKDLLFWSDHLSTQWIQNFWHLDYFQEFTASPHRILHCITLLSLGFCCCETLLKQFNYNRNQKTTRTVAFVILKMLALNFIGKRYIAKSIAKFLKHLILDLLLVLFMKPWSNLAWMVICGTNYIKIFSKMKWTVIHY